MEKVKIKNRKGQKIAVVVEKLEEQKGLAFVMHGLGGFKEQPHIIKNASHTFREEHHLFKIKQIFINWIDKVETL